MLVRAWSQAYIDLLLLRLRLLLVKILRQPPPVHAPLFSQHIRVVTIPILFGCLEANEAILYLVLVIGAAEVLKRVQDRLMRHFHELILIGLHEGAAVFVVFWRSSSCLMLLVTFLRPKQCFFFTALA